MPILNILTRNAALLSSLTVTADNGRDNAAADGDEDAETTPRHSC